HEERQAPLYIVHAIATSLYRLVRMILVFAVVGAVPLPHALAQTETEAAPAPFSISTLETVRARGYVICAAARPMPGFAQISPESLWSGFDVDVCRAVAAAIFGDPSRVEFRPLSGESRFAHLVQGEVDLLSRNAFWTMTRDTNYGVTYVTTSFFDGQAFMVSDRLSVVSAYELEDLTVCATTGSESLSRMRDFFFASQVTYDELLYEDREDIAVAYRS